MPGRSRNHEDGIAGRKRKHPAGVRDRAVRSVFQQAMGARVAVRAVVTIAPKIGCTSERLRRWVRRIEHDAGTRPGVTTSERIAS